MARNFRQSYRPEPVDGSARIENRIRHAVYQLYGLAPWILYVALRDVVAKAPETLAILEKHAATPSSAPMPDWIARLDPDESDDQISPFI